MQNLTVGDYYRIGADSEDDIVSEDGTAEYTIGKFVRMSDANGITHDDPALNTVYVLRDAKTYETRYTTPTEEHDEIFINSKTEDPDYFVNIRHLETKEVADTEPTRLHAAWVANPGTANASNASNTNVDDDDNASEASEWEQLPELPDTENPQGPPPTTTTTTTTSASNPTPFVAQNTRNDTLDSRSRELEDEMRDLQRQIARIEEELRSLNKETNPDTENPQGGRKSRKRKQRKGTYRKPRKH